MEKKVYVGNLPFKYRGRELKDLFSEYGEVEYATVILDRQNRNRSKGFGFVTFVDGDEADKAIAAMNGKEIDGRPLTVNEAKPRPEDDSSEKPEEKEEEKPVAQEPEAL